MRSVLARRLSPGLPPRGCHPCARRAPLLPAAHGDTRGARGAAATRTPSAPPPAPRAAFVAIGDELLAGRTADTNLPWLARALQARGAELVRAEFVPDEIDAIADSLTRCRAAVGESGIVVTSGGIGPTHDDVTYEAVAQWAGVGLSLHEPTVDKMRAHYEPQGKELNAARLRMATLPDGARVLETPGTWVPIADVRGVWVLPGIPRLFTQMISANVERFQGDAVEVVTLYTATGEGDLADALRAVAEAHAAGVAIGSYPATKSGAQYTTKITVSSRDPEALAAATEAVRSAIDVSDAPLAS